MFVEFANVGCAKCKPGFGIDVRFGAIAIEASWGLNRPFVRPLYVFVCSLVPNVADSSSCFVSVSLDPSLCQCFSGFQSFLSVRFYVFLRRRFTQEACVGVPCFGRSYVHR